MPKLDARRRKAIYDASTALASIAVVFGAISDDQPSPCSSRPARRCSPARTCPRPRHNRERRTHDSP